MNEKTKSWLLHVAKVEVDHAIESIQSVIERKLPITDEQAERLAKTIWNTRFHGALEIEIEENQVSSIPCDLCGGKVIEFHIPNDIWNMVIRGENGREHENEYLCWNCFYDCLRGALGLPKL